MPGHPSISRVPRRSSAFRWGVAAVAFVAAIANPALADTTLFGPRKYKQTGTGTPHCFIVAETGAPELPTLQGIALSAASTPGSSASSAASSLMRALT